MIPRFRHRLLSCICAGALLSSAHAMSVQPPTFAELVAEAAVVARARVTQVESRAVTSPAGQRSIKTFVSFETLRPLKGEPATRFTLSFLGGEAEGENWVVPGMPTFKVGDEDYVFDTGRETICPLVGAMHGRYRVLTDPSDAHQYVARDNRAPLRNTDDVAAPLNPSAAASSAVGALSPAEFEQKITAEIKRPTRPRPQP